MSYLISIVLVAFSGMFSGLTLGLLSLDVQTLRRRTNRGDAEAAAILPLREKGNLLLTTLLLGNVLVNTTLSVYLGTIASGVVAGMIATALIVVFGEIVPQAVISRYALWFGAKTAWFTRVVIVLFYPIAYPIARALDYFLGAEIPTIYSHYELMDIISEHHHSEHSHIDADEERILHGALQFSHLRVREVMTSIENVFMVDEYQRLNDDLFTTLNSYGYSRVPVFSGDKSNVIGLLYVKDLLIEDEGIAVRETREAFEQNVLNVRGGNKLDQVLARMLKEKQHFAFVRNRNQQLLGIVTLEDIIEEIIQQEIEDEDDDSETDD